MERPRISVAGFASVSHASADGSVQVMSWAPDYKKFADTKYNPLKDSRMTFFKGDDGRYYPDYDDHTTYATYDMALKAPTDGDEDSHTSLIGHTPLSPFFSRHIAQTVVAKAATKDMTVIPGQCRLYSIHFPDEHASPPASTMDDGSVNGNLVSRCNEPRCNEPRKSIFTFVVEDRANLSRSPWDNCVTRKFKDLDALLNGAPL